jgi:hypothetical protein
MKKWIWRTIWVVLGLYFVVTVFVVPYLIRIKLPDVVHNFTGGTLQIEDVSFNPLILDLSLEGVRFADPEGKPLLSLQRFDVNLDVIHLLWGRLSIEYIGLYSPKLYVVRQHDGTFNFDWLTRLGDANTSGGSGQKGGEEKLPAITVEQFELEDGSVALTDLSQAEPFYLEIEPIGLELTDVRMAGGGKNRFHFYAGTGFDEMLDIQGAVSRFQPFAVKGKAEYNAGKLYLIYYFLQNYTPLEVAEGRLHFGLTFDADMAHPEAMAVDHIRVALRRLRITQKNRYNDVLRIGEMTAVGGPVYPMRREATVDSVSFDRAFVGLERLRDGSLNWQHYFPAAGAAEAEKSATPAPDANVTAGDGGKPWNAAIREIALRNAQIRFADTTLSKPAVLTLDDINLTLGPVTTDMTKPVDFKSDLTVNGRGSVDVNGSATPKPLHADAQLRVDGVALSPFSPYVEDKTFAKIMDGRVSVTSRIAYAPSDTKPDLSARGDFRMNDLLVDDVRDNSPLASVTGLEAKAYLIELQPNRLFVDTAGVDGFYANVVVDRNKTLNFAEIVKPSAQKKPAKTPAKKPAVSAASHGAPETFPVRIVRTVIKNGAVHFADESLPLPFDTQIHDVGGQVLGVSTVRDDTTFLSLNGEIDRYGVARAEGSLNAADPKTYTDINLAFRNIDLHSLTPYSGKFVGRAIDTGKLTVARRYKIVDGKMKGANGIVIDKIVLGRKIKSKDAVSLPLDFAIALLEDRDGVIDIDMPVKGDVDKPDFEWGGVVWKAFVNLLTKAVTAPFDLIGAMLGIEGDQLKYIPFEAGSAVVDAASRERLDKLADALAKRPKLGITVQGTYNAAKDTTALKRAALVKEVLGTKAKQSVGAEDALVPGLLEPIYEKRLGKTALEALKQEIAKLDTDEENKARIYGDRLIAALIKTQPLPEHALDDLAQHRQQAIANYLESNRAVEAARITAKKPKAVAAEEGAVATQIGLDAAK